MVCASVAVVSELDVKQKFVELLLLPGFHQIGRKITLSIVYNLLTYAVLDFKSPGKACT